MAIHNCDYVNRSNATSAFPPFPVWIPGAFGHEPIEVRSCPGMVWCTANPGSSAMIGAEDGVPAIFTAFRYSGPFARPDVVIARLTQARIAVGSTVMLDTLQSGEHAAGNIAAILVESVRGRAAIIAGSQLGHHHFTP